jgi:hypothetical protein
MLIEMVISTDERWKRHQCLPAVGISSPARQAPWKGAEISGFVFLFFRDGHPLRSFTRADQ